MAFIVTCVGLIALVSPPNNWDSMTYHMSRVVHWIQNRNVAFYPTHISRQLSQNPWAEFAIMQFQILCEGDRFANLVQWFSMVGSIVGVSLIAERLGANLRGQLLAGVVVATIPMGILQASSTQNDYVVSFWLVCFVYYTTRLLKAKEKARRADLLGAGASLGLAILTKATAYIFAFPFLVWFVFSHLRKVGWRSLKSLSTLAVICLSINLGHYVRNYDLYGNPLGPAGPGSSDMGRYANEVLSIPSLISNMCRNASLHIGTPIKQLNAAMERGMRSVHRLLGVDINDPRTTFGGTGYSIRKMSNHEDEAGNIIHLALVAASVAILIVSRQVRESPHLVGYSIAVTAAFVLFCLYLKWQPWNSRLHLPLFVLWAPFIAVVSSSVLNHRAADLLCVVLMLSALPWVFYNNSRPLIGNTSILKVDRIDQYFSNRPELRDPYIEAALFLKSQQCSHIGLHMGGDSWEYPFWVLLHENHNRAVRFEHVNVGNKSSVKSGIRPFHGFSPCAIVSVERGEMNEIVSKETVYSKEWSSDPISVFMHH